MNPYSDSRIKLNDIKNHKAFKLGLPRFYILPTPIPFSNLFEPISPNDVPKSIKDVLKQIGIEDNELETSLSESNTNPVKIFVLMMTQRLLLEELPWEKAINEIISDPQIDENLLSFNHGIICHDCLTNNEPLNDNSFIGGYSVVSRASWFSNEPTTHFDRVERFEYSTEPLSDIIFELQQILINNNFIFFHPDDLQLIGKENDNNFVRIVCEIHDSNQISLTLSMRGDVDYLFSILYPSISKILPLK